MKSVTYPKRNLSIKLPKAPPICNPNVTRINSEGLLMDLKTNNIRSLFI